MSLLVRLLVVFPHADLSQIPQRRTRDIEGEIEFFNSCLELVRQDMRNLHAKLAGQVAEEERQLFDVYIRMLDDAALGNEIVERIRMGFWAQGSLAYVANRTRQKL